eukprot:1329834-Pyramimonas_sp.AAC.1
MSCASRPTAHSKEVQTATPQDSESTTPGWSGNFTGVSLACTRQRGSTERLALWQGWEEDDDEDTQTPDRTVNP